MLKISAVYLIGNPEICQDSPAVGKMIRPFHKKEPKEEWTFEIIWTHFEVLYPQQSPEFMIPHFMITIWNQKSRNAGTPYTVL